MGNHGSICDSRPIAISGYPRGTTVRKVTYLPNSKVETHPRPVKQKLVALASQLVSKPDRNLLSQSADQAIANTFFGSYSSRRCQTASVTAASLRATEMRAISGLVPWLTKPS